MDSLELIRLPAKSEWAGRNTLDWSVRSESPALLASRAAFQPEGQKGGWPWPPQQRGSPRATLRCRSP
jgi:hypothetical protein